MTETMWWNLCYRLYDNNSCAPCYTLTRSNFSINHPASAKLTHSKNVECTGASHTQNFSDGYHLGKVDCQAGHDYRGGHTSQTKWSMKRWIVWRDGYKAGWYGDRCRIPWRWWWLMNENKRVRLVQRLIFCLAIAAVGIYPIQWVFRKV